jgi:pSer/pThr/pTyr-binding forkhead associated (FHA) protein
MNVKLLVVQGKPAGKALLFAPGQYYLGRGAECHVRFNSDWVSRQHCLLRVTADGAYLSDLGSRNGTLVNGVLVRWENRLAHGDQVQIGPVAFEVFLDPPTGEGPPPGRDPESILPDDSGDSHRGIDSTASHPGLGEF